MREVYVVDGVRTAIGDFQGSLREYTASELGAAVVGEVLRRTGVPAEAVEEVVLGCVGQVGEDAYVAQAVAVMRDAGLDAERTNPNGGAIAHGHPLGATGAILTVKAMYELWRRRGRYALGTLCIGGGQGIAAVFERVA